MIWIVVQLGLLRDISDTDKRGLHSCRKGLAEMIRGRDRTSRCFPYKLIDTKRDWLLRSFD